MSVDVEIPKGYKLTYKKSYWIPKHFEVISPNTYKTKWWQPKYIVGYFKKINSKMR